MNKIQKSKHAVILCFLFWIFIAAEPGSTDNEKNAQYYHVRQEVIQQNGVLVSKPQDLDCDLLKILHDNRIATLDDYASWLEKNMSYREDSLKTSWREPLKIIRNRKGDCKEFATLTQAVTRVLGFEPKFLALFGKNGNHAVCVFKKDGRYIWFDNAKLRTTDSKTLNEFGRYITANYQYREVVEYDMDQEIWRPVYPANKRPHLSRPGCPLQN